MRVIALEAHFTTEAMARELAKHQDRGFTEMVERVSSQMLDLDEGRLAAMDSGRVDVQVLSLVENDLEPTLESSLVHDANDRLAEAVARHPDRLAGFALLPMSNPDGAAVEFDRAVGKLGFKGAMISGTTGGKFLDDPRFAPVFEAAVRLGVPIYLHPGLPETAIRERYYSGFDPGVDSVLASAAWGWHVETGLHALRMVVGGVFDRFPNLQIILGHMGNTSPTRWTGQPGCSTTPG